MVAQAPTVIACKIAYGIEHLAEDIRLAGHQIRFLPNDRAAVDAYRQVPDHITAIWATSVCMGPEPVVARWRQCSPVTTSASGRSMRS